MAGPHGGFVRVASSLDEHVTQLGSAVGSVPQSMNQEFVRSFLRPRGLDIAATDVFSRAIEELARLPRPGAGPRPWWVAVARPPAYLLARLARTLAEDRPFWVYGTRPLLAGSVWAWAAAYSAQEASHEAITRANKRVRRGVRRALHHRSRELEKGIRRTRKKLTARIRGAGAAAKRVARRSSC
jgi:hypothetical protein